MDNSRLSSEQDVDKILSLNDTDIVGIRTALKGIGSDRKCANCSMDIIIFDAFYQYSLENLKERRIDERITDY